jgi:CRISPR/Cas system-associated endoribonuclease Cas2
MGILQKILIHSTMKEEQERLEKTPRWIWMVVYDLSQASSRVKTKEAKNLIKEIQQNIFTNAYDGEIITKYSKHHFLKLIATAVRWAELENRNIKIN